MDGINILLLSFMEVQMCSTSIFLRSFTTNDFSRSLTTTVLMISFFAINHIKIIKVSKSKGGEDNDVDEEDAGVNSTWVVPSRSSFPPCRAKKGPCSHACSVKRGQGELRCA